MTPEQTLRIQIPMQSPMLDAHFPGHPIVPGAALLDLIMSALSMSNAITVPCKAQAKFLQPVRPGDELLVRFNSGKFEARVGEIIVCSGQFK